MTPEAYAEVLATIAATSETDPARVATCGTCGFQWDDSMSTDLTPAPAGRCPNEYNHAEMRRTWDEYTVSAAGVVNKLQAIGTLIRRGDTAAALDMITEVITEIEEER